MEKKASLTSWFGILGGVAGVLALALAWAESRSDEKKELVELKGKFKELQASQSALEARLKERDSSGLSAELKEALRSDPDLVALLQGPPGKKGETGERGPAGPVVEGMVAAFQGRCPKDWQEVPRAKGRFLLGAGNGIAPLDTGGSSSLSTSNMPHHTHSLPSVTLQDRFIGALKATSKDHGVRDREVATASNDQGWSESIYSGEGGDRDYPFGTALRTHISSTTRTLPASGPHGSSSPSPFLPHYFAVSFCTPR